MDQSAGLGDRVIGHRRLWGAGQLDGLVEIMDRVRKPQECMCWNPYICKPDSESACGVYSTFESNTSKHPLETPRPKSARVFRSKLHAWYVKARAHIVTDGPLNAGTLIGTLTAMLLRLCTPRRKIMCGCYTKIV